MLMNENMNALMRNYIDITKVFAIPPLYREMTRVVREYIYICTYIYVLEHDEKQKKGYILKRGGDLSNKAHRFGKVRERKGQRDW